MNIKTCFFCQTGVAFKPIMNAKGEIISTHSICRNPSCPMNQKDLTALKLKSRKSTKRSRTAKRTTKKKSRHISGLVVGMTTLAVTFFGCNALASFEMPSSEILYQAPQTTTSTSTIAPKESVSVKPETIKEKIMRYALKYDVSPVELENIVKCETGATDVNKASTTIQSRYLIGTPRRELSFGVSQIHVSAHGITKEQAYDVDYSLDFLAKHWSLGHKDMWYNCSIKNHYL